ncbi:helix-turn-helix domain-containing protein [Arthrobacter sp. ERGS1:01]|uniref:helix-turn-helix domain-containing protein n=1 Tax=Arthrobacter sp. ERGS1:01 TaxID=1704044 RepID=UPI000A5A28FC|nr:helix-turn-helix domain-containing protein [Arthrobacter sp. ERGS1:01]
MTTKIAPEAEMPRGVNRWMSPQEVCDELRIPKQTFYQWRARHVAPPAYRFGKLLRIERAEFERWLACHAEGFEAARNDRGL